MVAIKEEGLIPIVDGSMVVIVGRRGCSMNYVAQRLLEGLKAYPTTYEVSEGCTVISSGIHWGELIGGFDRLIAIHVSGELIPMLKAAGAIWL
ncbi:P-loop containing nucleoside triphosphate hydrolase protein [Dioscorea alata]|uniref:P-loop containing nucleoside triphosphate hydrolase protein n=1 Tax=Dioscorea alata TaxID=55571 RepID=A0ACB7WCP6_DIOAL|nr:P-loop containing nucleoside triphosphate hydrolase protein [Dioscorea alata]